MSFKYLQPPTWSGNSSHSSLVYNVPGLQIDTACTPTPIVNYLNTAQTRIARPLAGLSIIFVDDSISVTLIDLTFCEENDDLAQWGKNKLIISADAIKLHRC